MQMIGCDLHSRQQTLAIFDTETGVLEERVLEHTGDTIRDFYRTLPRPALVGIEATGSMHWFLQLMEELDIECRVGHPAMIRASEPRKQKHDRRDAQLLLRLLSEQTRGAHAEMPERERGPASAVTVGLNRLSASPRNGESEQTIVVVH